MKFRPFFRFFALLLLPVALLSGASLAHAQGGASRTDEMAKAERAAKAREQAKELEKDSGVKAPLQAVVPLDPANVWVLELSTGGTVKIQLRPDVAPQHVARVKELTNRGFYNGLLFHRVIDGFMAQGGDPKGDGTGGSDLPDLHAEFNDLPHVRGTVSMARAQDENSANSQFFIMLMPRLQLDRKYTVLGRVIEGMSYVDAIPKGEPAPQPAKIVRAYMMASGN
ncbi:MAG: peptidylprolyl isomerase [Sphingobium sp.]|nr:peptidylprolyl isomerase [Sphingobium sp.]